MKYLRLCAFTSHLGVEHVTARLLAMGISETVVDDPADMEDILSGKESYEWDYVEDELLENRDRQPSISLYLEDTPESRDIIEEITEALMAIGDEAGGPPMKIQVEEVDDSQWKDKWKEYFKPIKVSETIVVKPTWEEYEPLSGEKVIEIDPGMAFGTGSHETTSLCIKLLEKYVEPGETVLDVGCGSGILSIAAALLGGGQVLGVDIDREAVRVSRENIKLNGMEGVAEAQYGDLNKGLSYKADIVVANLMADLVIGLTQDVRRHMTGKCIYISSGILLEKRGLVESALLEKGFQVLEVMEDGEWCAIAAQMLR